MSDFYQTGIVTTLHRLGRPDVDRLEGQLVPLAKERRLALVLPSLYSELERPALEHIVSELSQVPYLHEIIISLDGADGKQFDHAREFFSRLPQRHRIIWGDGQRIQALYDLLRKNDLFVGDRGKGRGAWMAYGYILAGAESDVIALHDCDVLTYNREMLARLVYPVVNPNLDYRFCKGYYSRITNRMHGRVTRLLMTPLIRSLQRLVGHLGLLRYLDSFRYILAGEFSMGSDLARANRVPSDWGLEVGMLAEIYRNVAVQRICQVDLAANYEHKHQTLSENDPGRGLMKMAVDISKSLFRTLAAEGVALSAGLFRTLQASYRRTAEDTIERFYADAAINGLEFERHDEETAVEAFTRAIQIASEQFLNDPLGAALIPNWNRVTSAVPDFLGKFFAAVEADNA
ncbi:MAG: glycosyl transferase [Acidobacteriota bacterium]